MFGKGMGNMAGMMKKVQKMQADMKKMQEELKTRTSRSIRRWRCCYRCYEWRKDD